MFWIVNGWIGVNRCDIQTEWGGRNVGKRNWEPQKMMIPERCRKMWSGVKCFGYFDSWSNRCHDHSTHDYFTHYVSPSMNGYYTYTLMQARINFPCKLSYIVLVLGAYWSGSQNLDFTEKNGIQIAGVRASKTCLWMGSKRPIWAPLSLQILQEVLLSHSPSSSFYSPHINPG